MAPVFFWLSALWLLDADQQRKRLKEEESEKRASCRRERKKVHFSLLAVESISSASLGSSRSSFGPKASLDTGDATYSLQPRGNHSSKMPPEPARTRRRRRRHASPSSSCFLVLSLLLASCTLSLQQSDLAASAHAPPILAGKVTELVRGGGKREEERTTHIFVP